MADRENTKSDYRERAADFTALTAVSPASNQTDAQAFQAAMWSMVLADAS